MQAHLATRRDWTALRKALRDGRRYEIELLPHEKPHRVQSNVLGTLARAFGRGRVRSEIKNGRLFLWLDSELAQ